MTRLFHETKAGDVSEGETFARAIENLRLVIEDVYTLGHLNNSHNNTVRGDGFVQIGQLLERVRVKFTEFATTGRMN